MMFKKLFLLGLIVIVALSFVFVQAQEEDPLDEFVGSNVDGYGDHGGGQDPYGDPEAAGGPPPSEVKEFNSWEEIETYINEDEMEPAVIGYFEASNDDDITAFKDLASSEGLNFRFGLTTDQETLESKKYDTCAVVVYPPKKFVNEKSERSKHRFPGKSIKNSQSLLDFIRLKSLPLVGEYTQTSRNRYEAVKRPMVTLFTNVDHKRNSKGFNYIANRLRKIAKEYATGSKAMTFNIANIHDFREIMDSHYSFNLGEIDVKKTYAGIRDEQGEFFYTMEKEFSFDALNKFIQDFHRGVLEGFTKKEAPPAAGEEGGDAMYSPDSAVTQLTSDNFKEIVEESSADVLLEFYAPWCGHCKSLKPEYEAAAQHFQGDSGVVIAAMDATAHNPPSGYDVQGYPTLMFVPANTKKAVPYEEGRDTESIIEFINRRRTTTHGDEL